MILSRNGNEKIKLKVLGIYHKPILNSDIKSFIDINVFNNLFKKENQQTNTTNIKNINLYIKDVKNLNSFVKELREINKNFYVENNLSNLTKIINDNSKNVRNLTYIFFGLTSFATLLIFIFYLKFHLNIKKKEMGILKVIGASKKQIIFYHLSHILLISLFSLIGIFVLFEPTVLLFNYVFKIDAFFNPSILDKIQNLFISWVVINSIMILFYFLSSYKVLRLEIAKLFKF